MNRSTRRITTLLAGAVLTTTMAFGASTGPAQAKDAFCTQLPGLRSAVDAIGNVDAKDLTSAFAAFAKGAKTFKDLEGKAPSAIKTDFKTMSTGMQAINAEIQKLKKIDITKADAQVKTMETNVNKIASDPKFGKAADKVAAWGKSECKYDLTA